MSKPDHNLISASPASIRRMRPLLPLALALALAGCQQDGEPAAGANATADTPAAAAAGLQIEGLETEKEQVSYMIGMDMAASLEEIGDEIDVDTLVQAVETTARGETPLMTEEQAMQVREAFFKRLQAEKMEEVAAEAEGNRKAGEAFLAGNASKEGVEVTESGLQYQVLQAGDGPRPSADDVVRVHYEGTLLDGETFDSSHARGEPSVIPLQQVVPGWQEGIALMPVGSKYRFWIPSALAYGEQGTPDGPIGPNATLVFEVELLDIVQQPGQ